MTSTQISTDVAPAEGAEGPEGQLDQEIAAVVTLFGEVVERISAPRAGSARLIWAYKAVNTGDPIVKCWEMGS